MQGQVHSRTLTLVRRTVRAFGVHGLERRVMKWLQKSCMIAHRGPRTSPADCQGDLSSFTLESCFCDASIVCAFVPHTSFLGSSSLA